MSPLRMSYSLDGFEIIVFVGEQEVLRIDEPDSARQHLMFSAIQEAYAAGMRDALAEASKDAERYRFVRDADRSDCITYEIGLYAMESLDEYVDAAMEGEARLAAIDAALTPPEQPK